MRKPLAEGLGAFFLVLIVVLVNSQEPVGSNTPLAAGLALAGLTAVFGPVSGAHFNPAVTLAMLISGRISRTEAPYYMLAQILGAISASFFGVFMLGCIGNDEFPPHRNDGVCSMMSEFLGAFIFTLAFLRLPVSRIDGAAACGAVLSALMFALGPVSMAVFNPALAVGLSISGWTSWADIWLYLIGTLLGAAAAASAQIYFASATPDNS